MKAKDTKEKTGKERRRYARFKSLNIIRLMDEKGRPTDHEPKLVNLSEGGLCFYCDEAMPSKNRVAINIQIAEFNCVVQTFARVIWSQASTRHAGSYFTGAEFVGMDESDRQILRRLSKFKPKPKK